MSTSITGVLTDAQIERLNEITKDQANNQKIKAQNLDKDAFLKILMTQLQNQDPMSPLEDSEFIGQMAQFSSVEQLSTISKQMEKDTENSSLANEKLASIETNIKALTDSIEKLSGNSDTDNEGGLNRQILNELIKLNKSFEAYNG